MLKGLGKREKIISCAASFAVFLLFCSYTFLPLMDKISGLNREIKFARIKLKNYGMLLSREEAIKGKYATLSAKGHLNPGDAGMLGFVSEIENLCKNANVRILEMRPENKNGSLSIEVRTSGAMEDYLKLFYDIENSPCLLKMEKFWISFKRNGGPLEGVLIVSSCAD